MKRKFSAVVERATESEVAFLMPVKRGWQPSRSQPEMSHVRRFWSPLLAEWRKAMS